MCQSFNLHYEIQTWAGDSASTHGAAEAPHDIQPEQPTAKGQKASGMISVDLHYDTNVPLKAYYTKEPSHLYESASCMHRMHLTLPSRTPGNLDESQLHSASWRRLSRAISLPY